MTGNGDLPGVLCVGRLYCDLIFTGVPRLPTLGTEVFCDGLSLHAGGGAAISAAHFAMLGHPASLAATLPTEPFGTIARKDLKRAGVNLDLCAPAEPSDDPQITVAMVQNDERAFLTRRAGAPFPPFDIGKLRTLGVSHLHIGEFATLIEAPELLRIVRAAHVTISLDCSWDDKMDTGFVAELLSQIDVFLPNAVEAKKLREVGVAEPFAPLTVVKQGKDGATAFHDGRQTHMPSELVKPVDTTGAGDAFNAGFLSSWLMGDEMEMCLSAGHRQGAKAVRQRGGFC